MNSIQPEKLKVKIENAEIEYLLYRGKGPTIFFLHATGFLPWLWHPVARRLCGEYQIVAPYFCDHREREPEEGGLPWDVLARDLYNLCSYINVDNPYFVGHSMGATVITLSIVLHNMPAKGIVLMEPIYLPRQFYKMNITVEEHPLASRSIKRKNHWKDQQEARNYLRSKSLFSRWDDEMLELYIKHGIVPDEDGGLCLACHPRKEASLFMGGGHYDPWPLLSGISCPALVLEGEVSENRDYIDLKKASSLLPLGQYRMVQGAGHLIPMEQPEYTAQLINEFFKSECQD